MTLVGKELKDDVSLFWAVVDTGDISFYDIACRYNYGIDKTDICFVVT